MAVNTNAIKVGETEGFQGLTQHKFQYSIRFISHAQFTI